MYRSVKVTPRRSVHYIPCLFRPGKDDYIYTSQELRTDEPDQNETDLSQERKLIAGTIRDKKDKVALATVAMHDHEFMDIILNILNTSETLDISKDAIEQIKNNWFTIVSEKTRKGITFHIYMKSDEK